MALDQAIDALQDVLAAPAGGHARDELWRDVLHRRLTAVREALAEEAPLLRDGWLNARDVARERDRCRLLERVRSLTTGVPAPGAASSRELHRLGADLEHYRQRLHDLAYDAVGLELGGSE
ncbi:MAG: hypothetical protein ACTHNS_06555 [Marmoricola sp.]